MKNGLKTMGVLALLLVTVFALAGLAEAAITVSSTELNGKTVYDTGDTTKNLVRNFGRSNEISISVELVSDVNAKNVQVEAEVSGLEHDSDKAVDRTDVFDMKQNVTYVKDLKITLPSRMDQGKTYRLRVRIEDQSNQGVYKDYYMYVDSEMHSVDVKDVIFSPEYEVVAGRALLTQVQLRNTGVRDEESLKVKVSIPDLGVSQTVVVDKLDSDDVDTTEPLFMRIPDCAAKGTYNVIISVTYDDGDEMTDVKKSISVVGSDSCRPVSTNTQGTSQTLVSLPSTQDVVAGNEAVFPVLLTNAGNAAKTYSLNIQGLDSWGTVRVEPGMTQVVNAGQTNAVYVYVTPNRDASAGQKTFVVEIKSGDETKPLTLTANVVKSSSVANAGDIKKALVIGLVIIVAILVILGLIVGYNKMKENDNNDDLDSEDGQSQTYY